MEVDTHLHRSADVRTIMIQERMRRSSARSGSVTVWCVGSDIPSTTEALHHVLVSCLSNQRGGDGSQTPNKEASWKPSQAIAYGIPVARAHIRLCPLAPGASPCELLWSTCPRHCLPGALIAFPIAPATCWIPFSTDVLPPMVGAGLRAGCSASLLTRLSTPTYRN